MTAVITAPIDFQKKSQMADNTSITINITMNALSTPSPSITPSQTFRKPNMKTEIIKTPKNIAHFEIAANNLTIPAPKIINIHAKNILIQSPLNPCSFICCRITLI